MSTAVADRPDEPEPLSFGQQASEPNERLKRLADSLYLARLDRDASKASYERAQDLYDVAEAALFDAMENAGLVSIRTANGLFGLNDLAWPRVEDADRLRTWAEHEHPELLNVNLQRLQVPLREAIKNGTELPPGLGYFTSRKIRVTAPR